MNGESEKAPGKKGEQQGEGVIEGTEKEGGRLESRSDIEI